MAAQQPAVQQPSSQTEAPDTEKWQIFVVDDHPLFRMVLVALLKSEDDLAICGEAETAASALSALREVKADCVILDVILPGSNGIELLKQIRAEHPELAVLVISAHDESTYAIRALRAGALGYVMKRSAPDAMVSALRKVLAGQVAVSAAYGEQLISKVIGAGGPCSNPLDVLTDRELEVLELVGNGLSTQQIAASLHLSATTIESHRLHIKDKLDLATSNDLVRFATDLQTYRAS